MTKLTKHKSRAHYYRVEKRHAQNQSKHARIASRAYNRATRRAWRIQLRSQQ